MTERAEGFWWVRWAKQGLDDAPEVAEVVAWAEHARRLQIEHLHVEALSAKMIRTRRGWTSADACGLEWGPYLGKEPWHHVAWHRVQQARAILGKIDDPCAVEAERLLFEAFTATPPLEPRERFMRDVIAGDESVAEFLADVAPEAMALHALHAKRIAARRDLLTPQQIVEELRAEELRREGKRPTERERYCCEPGCPTRPTVWQGSDSRDRYAEWCPEHMPELLPGESRHPL